MTSSGRILKHFWSCNCGVLLTPPHHVHCAEEETLAPISHSLAQMQNRAVSSRCALGQAGKQRWSLEGPHPMENTGLRSTHVMPVLCF